MNGRTHRGGITVGGLVVALLAVSSVGAWGQQPTQAQASAIRGSCRSDYQTYCASVPTGGSAALACLQHNVGGLSPSCQEAVNAVGGGVAAPHPAPPMAGGSGTPRSARGELSTLRGACAADYRRLCRGVRLGGGRALACLKDNAQSLSPPCEEALMSLRGGG